MSCPTNWLITSHFTSTANAGAAMYKSPMKSSDQATEVLASETEGVV